MRRIKPKWLLGGAVLLAAIAVSTMAALATAPTAVNIDSPTNLNPFYRAEGSVVRVDFTYTSNPTNLPQETTGTVEIWTVGGGTRVAYAQKDLANGTDKTDYINVTLPSSLSEGYYDVRVYINNSDGGPATDEESSAVLVDNSDPDPVTDLAVWEDDDSGSNTDSSPDGYLNDTSPTVNWTAPDDNGATPSGIEEYVIKLVGAVAGTVFDWTETHNSATTYTITGPLGQDTYTFYLKARDKAGNESTETTEIFTIDTTPPDAPIMDDEPEYTAGTTNTVSWTNPTGACGVEIAIDEDGNQLNGFLRSERSIYLDPQEPPTSTEFSGLEDGHQYWYYARSQDLAGNWSGWSSAVTSTQDATAPAVSVTAPTNGVKTSDTTPDFTANATDGGSGVAYVKFEYSSNGGADWATISTDTNGVDGYAADWGALSLPDGSIILRATATNGAGLTESDQVTITVDTSEPDVAVTAPADDTYVPTGQPTFTAEALDTVSGITSVTFQYSSDGGSNWNDIGTDTNGADGFAAVWGGVSLTDHAPHKLRAVATNGAELSATSAVVDIAVDTTPPTILITAPANGDVTNDNTPTFTANANEDYSGIESVLFEYSSDGGATWTTITTDNASPYAADWGAVTLPNGSIILRATATNGAGTPASDDVEIFVDTVAPGTPGVPVAGNLGDDGNWYINTLWPTFTWDASVDQEPSSGIRDYTFQFGTGPKPDPDDGPDPDTWAGMLFEETGIPAGGTAVEQWTTNESIASWGVVAGEAYLARVKAYDNAGNESLWTDSSIIYDPDPPTTPGTPTTTSPTNDSTPTWTWGGSTDAISGVDLYHIQIRRTGSLDWDVLDTVLDVPDPPEPGDQTWEQGLQLQGGTYEIRVQAMDVAGNYSAWSGIGTVAVDVNPPTVPVMAPEPEFTVGTSNTVSWSASTDAETGLAGYEIRIATSQGELAIAVPVLEASTSKTYTGLSDGQTYYYQVRAVDNVGNASAWSGVVSSTQDTSGPTTPGTPSTTSPTNDTTPTWTWTAAEDDGVGVGSYYVSLTNESGTLITAHPIGNVTTFTYDDGALTDGKYYLRVKAIDALGNDDDSWSSPGEVVIDATGPTVTAGVAPTSPTNNPRPTWTWSGDDGSGTGVQGYWVTLDGEAPIWTTDTAFTPGANLPDGDHVLKVKGVDDVGNEGAEVTLATVTVDTTAPGVPGMPQTASPTADTTPTWTWAGVEGAASYNVYLDDEYVTSVTEPSYTVPDELALGDGEHYLQVSALDDLGNESALSEAGYVVIDTAGPVAPVVTRLTPSPTNEGPQIWTWTRPADAVRYDFGESSDGETPPTDPVNVGNADTYETSFTADGTHYVMVRAYDALGNVGPWSAAASVVIDMTAPGVPANLAVPSPTNDNTPTWTWTASTGDVARYEVSLDGAAAVNVGNVTSYTTSALADGMHNLKVRALDALGNPSEWAGPAEVLVDTVAPVITLINPEKGARLNITTASTVLAELLDAGSGVDQANVWVKIDDGEWVAPTAIVGGTLYYVVDLPFEATDDKWHSISIKAKDVAGNEKREDACFKVELYREGFGFGRLRFPEESD